MAHQKVTADSPTDELVYFIEIGRRAIKIGFSTNLEKRLADLQRGTLEALSVLATFPGGRDLDRKFHVLFACSKIRNEFFRDDGLISDFLRIAKDRSFTSAVEHVERMNNWFAKPKAERRAILHEQQREERHKAIAAKRIITIYPKDWNEARLAANRMRAPP
jgi:hypothetical protein